MAATPWPRPTHYTLNRIFCAVIFHFVHDGCSYAGAGASQGVPQGYLITTGIEKRMFSYTQLSGAVDHLSSKSFIDLPQVNLVNGHTRLF